jgi:Sulfotransferase family
MFFIVGSARSGTTLLRLILNAHPEVAVPPESRFIVELWTGRDDVSVDSFLRGLSSHRLFRAWNLPIEDVRAELGGMEVVPYRNAVLAAYRAFAKSAAKTVYGDKTPRYVEYISFLSGLFPDSRFVHLVRDGRNVAMSYADVPFGPKTVAKAATLWAGRVRAGMATGRVLGRGRYIESRYEDLVEDPEGEIKSVCRFLEIEYQPAMLEYKEVAEDALLPRAAVYNPNLSKEPTPHIRTWQEAMPEGQVRVFEAIAGDVLGELGYERRYPQPGTTARLGAALGRTGVPFHRLKRTRV